MKIGLRRFFAELPLSFSKNLLPFFEEHPLFFENPPSLRGIAPLVYSLFGCEDRGTSAEAIFGRLFTFTKMLCIKIVYKDKRAPVHWSAAKNKERFSSRRHSGYQLLVNRSLCFSMGLHRISFVFVFGEMFRRHVVDVLEGTRDTCLLGELFSRRPVLPDPAPPSALRPDPTLPWYIRVLDSTSCCLLCI